MMPQLSQPITMFLQLSMVSLMIFLLNTLPLVSPVVVNKNLYHLNNPLVNQVSDTGGLVLLKPKGSIKTVKFEDYVARASDYETSVDYLSGIVGNNLIYTGDTPDGTPIVAALNLTYFKQSLKINQIITIPLIDPADQAMLLRTSIAPEARRLYLTLFDYLADPDTPATYGEWNYRFVTTSMYASDYCCRIGTRENDCCGYYNTIYTCSNDTLPGEVSRTPHNGCFTVIIPHSVKGDCNGDHVGMNGFSAQFSNNRYQGASHWCALLSSYSCALSHCYIVQYSYDGAPQCGEGSTPDPVYTSINRLGTDVYSNVVQGINYGLVVVDVEAGDVDYEFQLIGIQGLDPADVICTITPDFNDCSLEYIEISVNPAYSEVSELRIASYVHATPDAGTVFGEFYNFPLDLSDQYPVRFWGNAFPAPSYIDQFAPPPSQNFVRHICDTCMPMGPWPLRQTFTVADYYTFGTDVEKYPTTVYGAKSAPVSFDNPSDKATHTVKGTVHVVGNNGQFSSYTGRHTGTPDDDTETCPGEYSTMPYLYSQLHEDFDYYLDITKPITVVPFFGPATSYPIYPICNECGDGVVPTDYVYQELLSFNLSNNARFAFEITSKFYTEELTVVEKPTVDLALCSVSMSGCYGFKDGAILQLLCDANLEVDNQVKMWFDQYPVVSFGSGQPFLIANLLEVNEYIVSQITDIGSLFLNDERSDTKTKVAVETVYCDTLDPSAPVWNVDSEKSGFFHWLGHSFFGLLTSIVFVIIFVVLICILLSCAKDALLGLESHAHSD